MSPMHPVPDRHDGLQAFKRLATHYLQPGPMSQLELERASMWGFAAVFSILAWVGAIAVVVRSL